MDYNPDISPEKLPNTNLGQTALLVFSRSAAEEASLKPLGKNGDLTLSFYSSLIRQTEKVATASTLPLFWVDSAQQHGTGFAERLNNAMQKVFSEGFKSVIVIGNDCPALAENDIAQAKTALEQGQAVLGPARDGGTWLIGLTAEQFEQLSFKKLPWRTADLYAAMASAIRSLGFELEILANRTDIDRLSDLNEVLAEIDPTSGLYRSIMLLMQVAQKSEASLPDNPTVLWNAPDTALRAPPIGC